MLAVFELKTISRDAIPAALEKAYRYRLLNEPRDAESICRDILRADPEHQDATITLLLALTDQFGKAMRVAVGHARELLPKLADEYRREYYGGVICERWAKAQFGQGAPGAVVYDWLHQAMVHYQRAESIRPEGKEDAILRWNACARIIRRNEQIRPRPEQIGDEMHQDDVPV